MAEETNEINKQINKEIINETKEINNETNEEPLFHQLGSGIEEPMQVESLCMQCHQNGMTKMLLIDVPYFKKIVVSSFLCEHCSNKNEHIQMVEPCAPKGVFYELKLKDKEDLTRFVVRQETSTVIIPSLEFESPPVQGKSSVTPIEGLIAEFIGSLDQAIENHKHAFKEIADKIAVVRDNMKKLIDDNFEPFVIIIDDPSGNSYIENLHAPQPDPELVVRHYIRNRDQNILCQITYPDAEEASAVDTIADDNNDETNNEDDEEDDDVNRFSIPTNCMYCNAAVAMRSQKFSIPYFKDVLIFCYNCDNCGYKTNEVKSAGAIEPVGTIMTLSVENVEDISRDVLKSDFCNVKIPELGIELPGGTLGSSYQTLEALLISVKDQLVKANPFSVGDTAKEDVQRRMQELAVTIQEIVDGKKKITFIMDDPTGNSYIQNLCAPDPDPQLKVEHYERTFEQNEELGLNDMKTEDY